MSDPKYTTMMALHQALHAQPVEFETTVNGLLSNRIMDAIEKKREDVAKSIFGTPEQEVEADDTNAVEQEDNSETSELEQEVNAEAEEAPTEEEPVEEAPTEEAPEEKEEVPAEE